jgi:hypothetical protein
MAIKHMILLFVETPRKFITAVINKFTWCFHKQKYYIILLAEFISEDGFLSEMGNSSKTRNSSRYKIWLTMGFPFHFPVRTTGKLDEFLS